MSFDPALISAISSLAKTGFQLAGGISANREAKSLARESRRRGAVEAELERRAGRRLAGQQRAAFGKSGVLVTEGTPLDVLAQTAADAEFNATQAALGREAEAESLEGQGRVALTSGIFGAATTLLGAAEDLDLPSRRSTGLPATTRAQVRRRAGFG